LLNDYLRSCNMYNKQNKKIIHKYKIPGLFFSITFHKITFKFSIHETINTVSGGHWASSQR
jgi:hypothetical protein